MGCNGYLMLGAAVAHILGLGLVLGAQAQDDGHHAHGDEVFAGTFKYHSCNQARIAPDDISSARCRLDSPIASEDRGMTKRSQLSMYKDATINLAVFFALALIAGGITMLWFWKKNKALRAQVQQTLPTTQLVHPMHSMHPMAPSAYQNQYLQGLDTPLTGVTAMSSPQQVLGPHKAYTQPSMAEMGDNQPKRMELDASASDCGHELESPASRAPYSPTSPPIRSPH